MNVEVVMKWFHVIVVCPTSRIPHLKNQFQVRTPCETTSSATIYNSTLDPFQKITIFYEAGHGIFI
jgi:hypothetical protein